MLANVRVDDQAGHKASYQDHVGTLVQKHHGTFLVRDAFKTDLENAFPLRAVGHNRVPNTSTSRRLV